jgi:hypothetical protein
MTYQTSLKSWGKRQTPGKPSGHLSAVVYWFLGLTGAALACRIHLAYAPSVWVHLLVGIPPVLIACVMPMRLLQGWLSREHEEAKRPSTAHSLVAATARANLGLKTP